MKNKNRIETVEEFLDYVYEGYIREDDIVSLNYLRDRKYELAGATTEDVEIYDQMDNEFLKKCVDAAIGMITSSEAK